ncbi:MAG: hypothetical protein PF441_01620 [Desulfuromusa sp.]|jgi:hypothetical protein|nr:hypothetical protein [Desulfuromusa sp.]
MKQLFLLMTLICSISTGSFADSVNNHELLNDSSDQVLMRTVVPSSDQPQGEVQIIQRGDLLVVQTLIASRALKHVAAAIDKKEMKHWPEEREGYVASVRYREELFRATERVWTMFRQRADKSELRQYLVIEFILSSKQGLIALSVPHIAGDYGNLLLQEKEPIQVWKAPTHYVKGNMIEMIQDSFHLNKAAATELLETLWQKQRVESN